MYNEKLKPVLEDLENKDIELAGGSVVGIVLSTINSLIKYICNLTIGKKKYIGVEPEVKEILQQAEYLKMQVLNGIDKDKEVLEEILDKYKTRKQFPEAYIEANKKAVEFCMEVTNNSLETLKLAKKISEVGNKMLASDFKICSYYSFASVESSIVNVKINLKSIEDIKYKDKIEEQYNKILKEAQEIKSEICDI